MAEYVKWDGTIGVKDETDCVAKNTTNKFYVKVYTEGILSGRFYNSKNEFNTGTGLGAKSRNTGLPMLKYRQVSQNIYNLYKKFLTTGQQSFLNVAEREFRINGQS